MPAQTSQNQTFKKNILFAFPQESPEFNPLFKKAFDESISLDLTNSYWDTINKLTKNNYDFYILHIEYFDLIKKIHDKENSYEKIAVFGQPYALKRAEYLGIKKIYYGLIEPSPTTGKTGLECLVEDTKKFLGI